MSLHAKRINQALTPSLSESAEQRSAATGSSDRPESHGRYMRHGGYGQRGGLLRLHAILAPDGPIPVARSTWWAGVRSGRFPAPVKLGPRITAWRLEDIEALIERPGQAFSATSPARAGRPEHG